jgi:DNA-binding XRE family transcriptional regulator
VIKLSKNNKNSILNICKDDLIDVSLFVNWDKQERVWTFKKLNETYRIKELAKILKHDKTTMYQIRTGEVKPSTKLYFAFLDLIKTETKITSVSISSRNAKSVRIKKESIHPELIGLIHSDGHLNLIKSGKGQMFYFCNRHKELVSRFCELVESTFECSITIKKDVRDNTYYAYPPSVVGRIITKKIGWKTKNYLNLHFPQEEIPYYITGLFDGDGTIYVYKNLKTIIPTVKITTNSEFHALHIKYLLSKIGIYSRLSHETKGKDNWWNVVITRQKDFLRFISTVESKHPIKKSKIQSYLKKYLESWQEGT